MLTKIKRWLQLHQLKTIINSDTQSAWLQLTKIWSRANKIYVGPVGFFPTCMFEYEALEAFIEHHPDCEEFLIEGLSALNPIICGYCLVGLQKVNSSILNRLPESLLQRVDPIEWMLCNRCVDTHLGKFAETFDPKYSPPIQSFEIEKKWKSSKTIS